MKRLRTFFYYNVFLYLCSLKVAIDHAFPKFVVFQVRSLDPCVVTYMDEYAMLLKMKSDYSKLNKLVHDLLNIDPARPEVFVALSVLFERKDETGALSYAEKVGFFAFLFTDMNTSAE